MREASNTPSGPPVFACTSEDMHPYECDGPGKCRHCDEEIKQAASSDGEATSTTESAEASA